MIRIFFLIVLFGLSTNSSYAGVDQEFGGTTYSWTPYYNKFLSHVGFDKSYALVIGVGDYDNSDAFDPLPSEKDAIRMKNYLIGGGGFNHVRLITGDKVTRERIHELMNDFYLPTLTNRDRFVFYWSGHGETKGQNNRKLGYLPVKTSSNNPATMLSMQNVKNWDYQIKAKQTLYLLDACFSGIAAAQAMSSNREQTIDRVSRPSRQVLTAGLENQETIAINDLGGGVFTRALLDGLDGSADTQQDGVVTARELEIYVRQRVDHERRRVNWKYRITPVLYDFGSSEGDFFFVTDKEKLSPGALIPNKKPLALGVTTYSGALKPQVNPDFQYNPPVLTPNEADKRTTKTNSCAALEGRITAPVVIAEGSCFTNKANTYRSNIKQVTRDGIVYTNFLGTETTCYKNMQCSFGWENSPVFSFFQNSGVNRTTFIINSQ